MHVLATNVPIEVQVPAWIFMVVPTCAALVFAMFKAGSVIKNQQLPELRFVTAGFLTILGFVCLGTVVLVFVGKLLAFMDVEETAPIWLAAGLVAGILCLVGGAAFRYIGPA